MVFHLDAFCLFLCPRSGLISGNQGKDLCTRKKRNLLSNVVKRFPGISDFDTMWDHRAFY